MAGAWVQGTGWDPFSVNVSREMVEEGLFLISLLTTMGSGLCVTLGGDRVPTTWTLVGKCCHDSLLLQDNIPFPKVCMTACTEIPVEKL